MGTGAKGHGVDEHSWCEPVGVAACITPWNMPLQVGLAKIAPTLAARCTTILKPAPDTPWHATALGRLVAEETDIPAGVFNVVPTSDNAVRSSSPTTRASTSSASPVRPCGAPLMSVARPPSSGCSSSWGASRPSSCSTTPTSMPMRRCARSRRWPTPARAVRSTRASLVQRPVYDALLEKLGEHVRHDPVGRPERSRQLLRTADQRQAARSSAGVHREGQGRGRAPGARRRGTSADKPKGFYVEPTIFADVDPNSTIAQEEIFGPVLCVIPFDTEEEAIEIANHDLRARGHGGQRRSRTRSPGGAPGAVRNGQRQRRAVLQRVGAVRWLQAERGRARDG